MNPKELELLSPAKNLAFGKAAIEHGADAVYIGGPSFGARSSAGNPMTDIAALADYAHRFGARVLLALNTILCDDELETARGLKLVVAQDRVQRQQDPRAASRTRPTTPASMR
jgi:putative protease